MKKIIYALAVVLAGGCVTEHYRKSQGDVGQFILQQAINYGGNPTTTNNLPVVMSHWRYAEDAYGMQIYIPSNDYFSVEAFLNQAFAGKKQFGPKISEGGKRIHEYRMSPVRGGIQLVDDIESTNTTSIIIIRPKSKF
jgi:hypothetical protein